MITKVRESSNSSTIVSDIVNYLEQTVPPLVDTAIKGRIGFIVGNLLDTVRSILVCVNVTEKVLDEAVEKGCNLVIANHPIYIRSLVITPAYHGERCIIKAIKHNLSIYVIHNNFDALGDGMSSRFASLIGLEDLHPIVFTKEEIYKLTTVVPAHAEQSMIASFYQSGVVTVTGNPAGHMSMVANSGDGGLQERIITFFIPVCFKEKAIQLLFHVHPYEKVIYYVEPLEMMSKNKGRGLIGKLPIELPAKYFLKYIKTKLGLMRLKHTCEIDFTVKTVAVYAGVGDFLLEKIYNKGIDAFITAGLQYDHFLEAKGKILILNVDRHAAWVGVKKRIIALILKEFNNITMLRCQTVTNPIHYIND